MKKILIVSDLHAGSTPAIMPPVVELGPTATRDARTVHARDACDKKAAELGLPPRRA